MGVDIYKDSTKNNSNYVGDIEDGEWLQYTINVLKSGTYTFTIWVAQGKEDGKISITSNSISLAKEVTVAGGDAGKCQATSVKKYSFISRH